MAKFAVTDLDSQLVVDRARRLLTNQRTAPRAMLSCLSSGKVIADLIVEVSLTTTRIFNLEIVERIVERSNKFLSRCSM